MLVIGEENDENVGYDSLVLNAGMGKAFTDMQRLRSRVLKFAKHMRSFNKHMEEFESGMHECKRVWSKKESNTIHEEPPNYSPNKEYNNMQWKEEDNLNPNHHVDNPYPTIERQISNKDPLSFSSRGELVDRHPKKTENYNGVYSDEDDESFDSFDTDVVAACEGWDHSPKDMWPPSNGFGRFALNAKLSDDDAYFSALQTPPRGESEKLPRNFERRLPGHSLGFPKYFDLASVQEEDETFDYTIHDF